MEPELQPAELEPALEMRLESIELLSAPSELALKVS